MTNMIYEIRNYHFEPSRFEDYKAWAKNVALPYLQRELDLIGFWVNSDIPGEVNGAPLDELGPANITWIIAWPDKAAMPKVFSGDEWNEIFAQVPGGLGNYLRMESKFTDALI
jgi:hypothetical protein